MQGTTPRVPTTQLTNISVTESSREDASKPKDVDESLSEDPSTSDIQIRTDKFDEKDRGLSVIS